MSKIEKMKQELKNRPKTFDWNDARRILIYEGYQEDTGGKTSDSRVRFEDAEGISFVLHKPHKGNELKAYNVHDLVDFLEQEGKL